MSAQIYGLHTAGHLHRTLLASGFPCQPYSRQGDGHGAEDPRASAFWGTLRACWLMQSAGLILECVATVERFPFIMKNLMELAKLMNFQVRTTILSLQAQWPARRDRWWALLAPADFNLEDFATWPCTSSHSTIEHIIPRWPLWSLAEEKCLALTADEREHYDDPQFGTDVRLLELTSICPTILHSYSNALQTCPCGCRQRPFCRDRLLRGGLRGFYVISQVLDTPRYLHVQEAALMLTIPLTMKYPGDARTGLCLLGQSAAPLQVLWVAAAHLVRATQEFFHWEPLCSPDLMLNQYKELLLFQRYHTWTTDDTHATRRINVIDEGLLHINLLREGHQTVQDFLEAEEKLHGESRLYSAEVRTLTNSTRSSMMGCQDVHYLEEDDFTCGTIALAHLAACLDLTYYQPILTTSSRPAPHLLGWLATDPCLLRIWSLPELLVDKGVPREHVADRAQQALKKLPRSDVQQALQSKHPWAALKALGSRPTINYMWIQHDELLAKIKQKGAQQYGLQISASHKKKGGAKPGQHPVQVSPDDLELIPKSFLADDGSAIEQIAFQRIAKGQAGLAFATVQDITPYLRDGQIVSQGPLAVLTTLNIPHKLTGILPVIDLVFPAMHRLTNEPVLIKGSLIQLGTVHINREKHKNAPDIAPMVTCTLKLTVYRDQLPTQVNWSTFCEGPMKVAVRGLIKATPEKAQTWSALLRIPSVAQITLLSSSGSYSLYFDPRESSGRAPCPIYGVVWLPNTPHSDADKAISLIRFNDRYGIRFAKDTLAAGHQALRPDEPFNPVTVTELYRLHPLPFGVQRQGLIKTLKSWNWVANPASQGQRFRSRLGSRSSYTTALPGQHGDVVITKIRSTQRAVEPKHLIASNKTQHFLRKQTPGATQPTDPWIAGTDPWSAWNNQGAPASKGSTIPSDKLQQVEQRLRSEFQNSIRKEIEDQRTHTTWDMDTSDFAMSSGDPRINKLESDVAELRQRHSRYEQLFNEAALANQRTQRQIYDVSAQVTQQ
ncbi:unnamed protein product [Effrenium voratum]|nr:unnamed protein product [Effrenium voratum]